MLDALGTTVVLVALPWSGDTDGVIEAIGTVPELPGELEMDGSPPLPPPTGPPEDIDALGVRLLLAETNGREDDETDGVSTLVLFPVSACTGTAVTFTLGLGARLRGAGVCVSVGRGCDPTSIAGSVGRGVCVSIARGGLAILRVVGRVVCVSVERGGTPTPATDALGDELGLFVGAGVWVKVGLASVTDELGLAEINGRGDCEAVIEGKTITTFDF